MAPRTVAEVGRETDNMMVMIGRLLEAAKAASEGIKTLSDESRKNSVGVQAVESAITNIQRTLVDLERIVRSGGNDSLMTLVRIGGEEAGRFRKDFNDLTTRVEAMSRRIDAIDTTHATTAGGYQTLKVIGQITIFVVPTIIAILALIKDK